MQTCPACRTENPNAARFCFNCGSSLGDGASSPPSEIGRVHTDPPGKKLTANVSYKPGTVVQNRYMVECELGRGGMGTVLLCKDRDQDDELCCLKVINPQFVDNEELVERFKNEGRIARRIRHPGIIATHDIFQWNKGWHIAMEYFPGIVLRKTISEADSSGSAIPLEHAISVLDRLLDALHAAHEITVHRDLKPENVMLRGKPEDSNFEVKILDFGIAKNFEVTNATMADIAMGTTGYMAPEQARDAANVDARADVYACAVIFYELLTGLLPVGNYDPPTALRPELPVWVDSFVDKGLRYRPQARYASALDMREALQAAAEAKPGQEQPASAAQWPPVPTVSAQLPVLEPEAEERREARWLRVKLMEARQGRLHAVAFSPDGHTFATAGDDGTVAIWDARRLKRVAKLEGHGAWVKTLAFSPNGRALATGGGDSTVRIWDARTWREAAVIEGHEQPVIAVQFSPDGFYLASSGADQTAILWETQTYAPVNEVQGGGIAGLSFSPDGLLLASGTLNQSVVVWDVVNSETLVELKGHRGTITSLSFSPNGRYLLSGSDDSTIRVYELPGFERALKVRDHSGLVWSIAFSATGGLMASGGEDRILVLRRVSDWEEVATFCDHRHGVSGVAFSPDDKTMVSCGRDGAIAVYAHQ